MRPNQTCLQKSSNLKYSISFRMSCDITFANKHQRKINTNRSIRTLCIFGRSWFEWWILRRFRDFLVRNWKIIKFWAQSDKKMKHFFVNWWIFSGRQRNSPGWIEEIEVIFRRMAQFRSNKFWFVQNCYKLILFSIETQCSTLTWQSPFLKWFWP